MPLGGDWEFGLLDELIIDRGDVVTLETGMACPACRNDDPYASTISLHGRPAAIRSLYCSKCQGNGYMYRNARCIKGLVTGIQPNQRDLMDMGYASPGDAIFSPSLQAGYLGDFDRVTFTTTASVEAQVIMRGAATLNTNAALETDLTTAQDRLWYLPECTIWCEDANGVVYYEGTDFNFVDKKVNWVHGPDAGVIYTIKYRGFIEWIVYASPMERFDRGRNLGQRVVLRKKHVHMLTGSKAETPTARSDEQQMVNKPNRL